MLDHLQKGTVSLDALNTLVRMRPTACWIWDLAMPLMMSSFCASISTDASVFGNLAGSHRAISGRVQRDPLAIEIDSTDVCHLLNNNFMRHPAKAKFLCATVIKLASAILLRGVLQYQKDCQSVCDALNEVGQSALSLPAIWSNAIAIRPWYVLLTVAPCTGRD